MKIEDYLHDIIYNNIYPNQNKEITAQKMREVLDSVVYSVPESEKLIRVFDDPSKLSINSIGKIYIYAGESNDTYKKGTIYTSISEDGVLKLTPLDTVSTISIYDSTQDVIDKVPMNDRYLGQTFLVKEDDELIEYWFTTSSLDTLIKKGYADSSLNETSTNAIQNKAVYKEIDKLKSISYIQPLEIKTDQITKTSFKVIWVGKADSYNININTSDTTIKKDTCHDTSYIVDGLKSDTEYTVSIQSNYINTDDTESQSNWASINVHTVADDPVYDVWYLFDNETIEYDTIPESSQRLSTLNNVNIITKDSNKYIYLICKENKTLKIYDTIGEIIGWNTNANKSKITGYNIYRSDNIVSKFTFQKIELS